MNDFEEMRKFVIKETRKTGKKNIERAKRYGKPFFIGRIYITDGVRELGYSEESPELDKLFKKYMKCDWGEVREDAAINNRTIEAGYGDIMGIYRLDGHVIWIKTDLNEYPSTTILLPQEW